VTGTTLIRTTLTGVRPLGVRGEPLHHAQAQIRAVVGRRLDERHFHLLAEPQPHQLGGRIDWYSELQGPVRALPDLPEAERDAARADIDSLLADIDRLGQELEAGPTEDGRLAGRSLRLAAKRPSDDYLFLVGDQPVVVCWGYDTQAAGAVLPPAFLPGAAAGAPPVAPSPPALAASAGPAVLVRERFPWLFWLLAGLLAIAVLLLASWLLRQCMPVPPDMRVTQLPPEPPPPAPPVPPDPTIGLRGDLDAARDTEGNLKATLAALREEFGKRHAQCKAPEPPPAPVKPPAAERKPDPPSKPEPKPKVAERKPQPPPRPPDDRMRMPTAPTNDYSFLKGCWRTDVFKHGPRIPPGYATYCFDGNGRGTMEFRFQNGTTCRAPATARFSGNTLRVVDADSTCSPRGTWAQDRLDCTAGADGVAYCRGENRTERWTVNLHRTGN
jgi:hypothetical protein